MTTAAKKAKGRRLQQWVMGQLLERFPLQEDDVRSTSMGASGEDVLMSPLAQKYVPFSIECKNQEKINIWQGLKQAFANETEDRPGLLVFKRNRSETYVALRFSDFIHLLERLGRTEDKGSR